MKKNLLTAASYVLVAALSSFLTLFLYANLALPPQSKLAELADLIRERYVEEPDMVALEDAAASAMVDATADRWSYYISAAEYDQHMEQVENAYVGVGITIQATEEDAGFLVIAVAEGGPAEEAGLLPGDLLIAVEDQDVRGWTTTEVSAVVKGEEGTFVQMTVLRQGDHRSITVERRQVLTPVAEYEMLPNKVGLVTIYNFDERCARETIDAVETLIQNGAEKLIFDVRHNPGGFASEMVEILDYLLPEGDLFRMVDSQGKESVDRSGPEFLDIPMAVLVNGGSYSAAEFFAAALQEYDAALVLGEPTSGKGYYQNTFRLSDGSAVALSVGKYFTPQGKSLEGVGIRPDIEIEVDEETASAIYYGILETEKDPYIQKALDALAE